MTSQTINGVTIIDIPAPEIEQEITTLIMRQSMDTSKELKAGNIRIVTLPKIDREKHILSP